MRIEKMRAGAWGGAFLLAVLLVGCGDKTPIKVGFLGGVSGRVADLGVSGRNGAQLAVDQVNQQGGIGGRRVELVTRDDEQNPDLARRRFVELADAGVVAVIGPMTSSVAVAVVPLADERKLLLISPTATANELGGKDDYFIRVMSSTRVYGAMSARYQFGVVGMRKAAVIYDLRNKAYSVSWLADFKAAYLAAGGRVVFEKGFESGDDAGLSKLVEHALAENPEGIVLIANSVDAAILTQHVRRQSPALHIATAEWAATERFIELAGKAADGVVMAQFVDRDSALPDYVKFRRVYRERFGDEPGFAGVGAFDATNMLIRALGQAPQRAPRETILAISEFAGVQGTIKLNATGDSEREVFVTRVVDGRYVVVPRQRSAP